VRWWWPGIAGAGRALGLGKAGEVADAIRKGSDIAKHSMVGVSLRAATIPHEVLSVYGGARVLLRPASPGTGVIAGKTVRAVLEAAGVRTFEQVPWIKQRRQRGEVDTASVADASSSERISCGAGAWPVSAPAAIGGGPGG
jgi:hypothetical protein